MESIFIYLDILYRIFKYSFKLVISIQFFTNYLNKISNLIFEYNFNLLFYRTPLYLAVEHGSINIINALIHSENINPNIRSI